MYLTSRKKIGRSLVWFSVFAVTCMLCACSSSVTDPTFSKTPTESNTLQGPSPVIETCGLYTVQFFPQYAQYWKDCGIDTIQLVASGMDMSEDEEALNLYMTSLENQVKDAKAMGFQVYIVLLSNFRAVEEGESWYQALFDIADEQEMNKRLAVLERTVEACKQADGFTVFAADPGGYTNLKAQSTVNNFVYLCKEFIKVIRAGAPQAKININPWSVTSFETPMKYPGYVDFWEAESRLTAAILELENFIGADIGIEFSCHNYYRPLAIRLYQQVYGDNYDIPVYPTQTDVMVLYNNGCTRRWAWPYFLLDECDDGDGAGAGVQLETRYIYRLIQQLRQAGINGIIGNWTADGHFNRALNTYAFARMCADSTLTPQAVIREYAAKNVTAETVDTFAQILYFIENHSNWHQKMPESHQMAALETSVQSAQQALELLDTVQPLQQAQGVAEAPTEYMERVRMRLLAIASN